MKNGHFLNSISLPTYTSVFNYDQCSKFYDKKRFVFGTSGIGGVWGGINEADSIDTLLAVLESREFAIDTSPSYANAETYLGKAIKEFNGPLPFISTKVGRLRAEDAYTTLLDYSNEGITKSLYRSLETIGIPKIDLLFLHEPHLVSPREIPRILDLLLSFKADGLVDLIGIGGNLTEAFKPFMGKGNFEVVSGFLRMNACNLDAFKIGDVAFMKTLEIAYYNASILHFGLLGSRLDNYTKTFEQEKNWLKRKELDLAHKLKVLALANNISLVSMSQRFALSIAEADRIVVGAKNLAQFRNTYQDILQGPLPQGLFQLILELVYQGECN